VRTFRKLLAATACLVLSASAHAGVYKVDFTFTGFTDEIKQNGVTQIAPQDVVTGSITYEALSIFGAATAVDAFDMTIAGFHYGVADIAFDPNWMLFGGADSGPNQVYFARNDFFLYFSNANAPFGILEYSTAGGSTLFRGFGPVTITDLAAPVPEPGSIALLLAGAMGLGLASRRAKC
jgi:hypothetical protein